MNFGLGPTVLAGIFVLCLSILTLYILGLNLQLGHDYLFGDPFYLLFTVNLPFDTAEGKKLIVSVNE